jgi:hypothetical protein
MIGEHISRGRARAVQLAARRRGIAAVGQTGLMARFRLRLSARRTAQLSIQRGCAEGVVCGCRPYVDASWGLAGAESVQLDVFLDKLPAHAHQLKHLVLRFIVSTDAALC